MKPGDRCPKKGCDGVLRVRMDVPRVGPGILECSARPFVSPVELARLPEDEPGPVTHTWLLWRNEDGGLST